MSGLVSSVFVMCVVGETFLCEGKFGVWGVSDVERRVWF